MFKFSLTSRFLKDCFSVKYPTVQLFDDSGSWYCFPLKSSHIYDGKFMVRLNDRMFVLSVDPAKMLTYRAKGAPPIQTILYTTKDTKPIDLNDLRTVADFCKRNDIRKIHDVEALLICAYARYQHNYRKGGPDNEALSFEAVISMLLEVEGRKEGTAEYDARRAEYEEAVRRMGRLDLVEPVQPVANYLGNKLFDDPESITSMIVGASRMDFQWKKIANPAKSPTKWWMLILGVLGGLVVAIVAAYFFLGDGGGAQQDVFDQIAALDAQGVEAPEDFDTGGDSLIGQLFEEADKGPDVGEGTSDLFDAVSGAIGGGIEDLVAPNAVPPEPPEPGLDVRTGGETGVR